MFVTCKTVNSLMADPRQKNNKKANRRECRDVKTKNAHKQDWDARKLY